MDATFATVVQKLIADQGKEALLNTAKAKSLLADYAAGEFNKERRLLIQALEVGTAKEIADTKELEICKKRQIKLLHEDYFLTEEIAVEVVDLLALVLRTNTAVVSAASQTPGKLFCPECGASLPEGAKFCFACGKPVTIGQVITPLSSQTEQRGSAITSSGGIGYGTGLINPPLQPKQKRQPKTKGTAFTSSGDVGYGVRLIKSEFKKPVKKKVVPKPSQEEIFNIAIQKLTNTITQDPLNASAYIEQGECYVCNKDYKNARSAFKKAKKLLHKHSPEYSYVKNILKLIKTNPWQVFVIGPVSTGMLTYIAPDATMIWFGLGVVLTIVWCLRINNRSKKFDELVKKLIEEKTKS